MSDQLASTVLLVPSVSRSSEAKGDSGQGILLGRGRGCTAWETRGCLEGAGRDREAGSPAETKATRRWQEVRKGGCMKNKRGKDKNKPLPFADLLGTSTQMTRFKVRNLLFIQFCGTFDFLLGYFSVSKVQDSLILKGVWFILSLSR